ncbi:hypothetical protein GF380_01205 [Candidatus Uhrbacteria bacterium]|nr:hypothetical protein [Candidatus Uhrbacteria bacterium]MBD3284634.1 hypothetical protein [Candidatus Uhrbacteria bacterium]
MDKRQERVLIHVIEDYIHSAEPVSSQGLVKKHGLHVSSATIRNWFSSLEQEGYLEQPHTSAGRIPSVRAYEWYVQQLGQVSLPSTLQHKLEEILDGPSITDERLKRIAKLTVDLTGTAVLLGTNRSDTYYTGLTALFSNPEFQDWSKVISMSSVLDQLDRQLFKQRKERYRKPTMLIGDACPFGAMCGSAFLTLERDALFIILGPVRMNYKRAIGVLNTIQTFNTTL